MDVIAELLKDTLHEMQGLMENRTVVGEPIKSGDYTIIPISKVSFGFGGGGGGEEQASQSTGSGRGCGGGWTIEPIGFIVVGPSGAHLTTVGEKESVTAKLVNLAPKVMETVQKYMDKSKSKEADQATKPAGQAKEPKQ